MLQLKTTIPGAMAALLLIVASAATPESLTAQGEDHDQQQFLRIATTPDEQPRALQTAIVTYAERYGGETVIADLISALLIGDASSFNSTRSTTTAPISYTPTYRPTSC